MAELVSLDFVRTTKHATAHLREALGRVLAVQRTLIGRQKELVDLIWHVELNIPVRLLTHGAPVNLADLAAKTGKSEQSILREHLTTELYQVIVSQQKLRMCRADLRRCIRMAAKGGI